MTIKPFVFLLCASGFFYQTWAFLQMYLAYPTTLDISEDYPDSFMAPAITICNRNRLLRQPYCKAYPEECSWKHTTWDTFCDEYSRMCPKIKPTDFSFGIPVSRVTDIPNRSLNYLDALWPKTEYDALYACRRYGDYGLAPCAAEAHNIVIPRQGLPHRCFKYLLKIEGLDEEQSNLTLTDGFVIGLNMYPEEYFNTIKPVEASIVLHDPRKIVNPMTDGITLSAGKVYKVFATMERRESLPPPYASKCADYLTEWKKNGGFGPLSKDDCTKDCTISAMFDKYGCVGQTMTYPSRNEICHATSLDATSEMITKCASGCRDACEEYNYQVTSDATLDMQTQSIELFSYIGGYLGMWLGISLASVFDVAEMIYGVIDTSFLKRKRNEKTETPIQQFRNQTVIV